MAEDDGPPPATPRFVRQTTTDRFVELIYMGFDAAQAEEAVRRTPRAALAAAVEYILAMPSPAPPRMARQTSRGIRYLTDMGFTATEAAEALATAGNDVALALDVLLSSQRERVRPPSPPIVERGASDQAAARGASATPALAPAPPPPPRRSWFWQAGPSATPERSMAASPPAPSAPPPPASAARAASRAAATTGGPAAAEEKDDGLCRICCDDLPSDASRPPCGHRYHGMIKSSRAEAMIDHCQLHTKSSRLLAVAALPPLP